jgi:hypothetical protein
MSKAIEHVVTMCANLDAAELSNPDEEMMTQIEETSHKPVMSKLRYSFLLLPTELKIHDSCAVIA